MKKHRKTFLLILAIVAVTGTIGYRAMANNRAEEDPAVQAATVVRGTIISTLSSSGNSYPGQTAEIQWETSGKVGEVNLRPGDVVKEGQVLAGLDSDSLSSEIIQAKQDLITAQNALDDLLNSRMQQAEALQAVEAAQEMVNSLNQTSASDASQAQLALVEAQEAYEDAVNNRAKMDYPHSSDDLVIDKAETDYLLAKAAYKEAQKAFNAVANKKQTHPERVHALQELLAAQQKMEIALATYNWYTLGYSDAEKAQADAELAVAKANLEKAQADWETGSSGASSADVMMAEAQLEDAQREWERVKDGPTEEDIEAAESAVDAAQAVIDRAQLLAPFDGTLTDVEVKTGDLVSAGDAAFRIDDLELIYIDLSISEVDLGSLSIGQTAVIQFDAIPDQEYEGKVVEIGMVANVNQGVVNYPVTVQIIEPDNQIRPGMTASVDIEIAKSENVLTVPNRAIRTTGGQRSVTILYDGEQINIPVTVGLSDGTMTEVTSEQLREGDTILVSGMTSSSTNSGSSTGLPGRIQNFNGGGIPGGGIAIPGGGLP